MEDGLVGGVEPVGVCILVCFACVLICGRSSVSAAVGESR